MYVDMESKTMLDTFYMHPMEQKFPSPKPKIDIKRRTRKHSSSLDLTTIRSDIQHELSKSNFTPTSSSTLISNQRKAQIGHFYE